MNATSAAIFIASALAALYAAAIAYAIVQIWRTSELSELEHWVWTIAIVLFPLGGALVWFIAGPRPFGLRLTRDPLE